MVAAKTGAVHQGNPWLVAYKPNPKPMKKKLMPIGTIIGNAKENALRCFISFIGLASLPHHIHLKC